MNSKIRTVKQLLKNTVAMYGCESQTWERERETRFLPLNNAQSCLGKQDKWHINSINKPNKTLHFLNLCHKQTTMLEVLHSSGKVPSMWFLNINAILMANNKSMPG